MHDLLSTGVTCFSCYHKANRPFTPGMSLKRDPYVPARLMLRPTAKDLVMWIDLTRVCGELPPVAK